MTFSFYVHNDNQLNSLYRQLNLASKPTFMFWPKFYYSWFYTDEKTLFNILTLRQKIGPTIDNEEISEYNKIRVKNS
jgi:hypothetical protein